MSTRTTSSAFPVWRVVIIEDSPEDRAEIRRLLLKGSDRRYQFIEAETGAGGVRAILDAPGGPPDCVVLDYALPDMDALEVLAALTGPNGLAVCPLVVLTGSADPRHGPAVLRAGAQDFIGKDWMSAQSLTRVLENAAERWAMTCALQARTAALQASEAELQLAIEVAGLGVNRIDYPTGTVVLDATAAALFGVAAGVPLSRSVIHATFHPDDHDEIVRRMHQSLDPAGEGTFSMEHRVIHPNGSVRWLSVKKQVLFARTAAGIRGPVSSVLAAADITDRKVREMELRASEEFNRSLMDGSVDCVKVLDLQGRVLNINTPGLCAMEIDDIGTVCGLEWEAIWPAGAQRDIEQSVTRAAGGEVSFFQAYCPTAKGTPKWWEVTVSPVRDAEGGNVVRLLAISHDITLRKQEEAALSEYQQRQRFALQAANAGAWDWNIGTGEIVWSPENYALYDMDPALGAPSYADWESCIHPEDLARTNESIRATVEGKIPEFRSEFRVVHKNGDILWLIGLARARRDENGAAIYMSGLNLDITRQKRDEEQLRRLAAELSQASRRKDEFLATLAHELRNPLAPIRNGLQLMKLASGHPETVEQARVMMERQLTQMVRLVDDLMDVSRISQGKLELRTERLALETVVNSAVETSRPLIDMMGHELTVTIPRQPIMVDADMTRLAQVFMNLLNNAAKYSERGGHIWLSVELNGSDVVVSVKDSGIGMAAEQLPRIFEMFTQVDRSLEKSQGGLGIGLTLVKRLVEMHSGSVEARSEGPGQGSEFVVRLPLWVEAPALQAPGAKHEPEATQPSLRILIVDDNRDGADSLSQMLNLMGNHTRTAYDGQQAVDMAGEYRPDVVLLDIGLPKLNGYEACRRICEQPWSQNAVLIAVTGWGQDNDRRRSRESGFHHHLVKPVNPHDLMAMLAVVQADRDAGAPSAVTDPAA